MDGANEFQVLWKVYVPLSKPAIATVALFCVVSRWNGFFWAMVLLTRTIARSRCRYTCARCWSNCRTTRNSPAPC